jgi:hypothetical protein
MSPLSVLLFTLAPIILAGISNMVLIKLPVAQGLHRPMDGGRKLADGKRLLGDHKTWKGFWGMVVMGAWWLGLTGLVVRLAPSLGNYSLIAFDEFTSLLSPWLFGGLWGLAYVLAELPNSYVKRRINIDPGEQGSGRLGFTFAFIDQADSVLGCLLVMPLFSRITWLDAVALFLLATALHYVFNILLFYAGLKGNRG